MSINQLDLQKLKDELKTNLDRLQEDAKNFGRDMKTSQTDYIKNIDLVKKSFEGALLSINKDYEALIGPLEAKKNQALNSDIEGIKAKLKESVQQINAGLQKQGKTFQNDLDRIIKSSTDVIKQDMNKVSNHVEQVYSSEEKAINVIRDSLMNSVERAKELYSNAVKQRIESVRSATTDMLDDVFTNLSNFKAGASDVTRGGQDEIDALMREIIIEIESSYERSSASLRDIMQTIESNIKETFDSKEEEFKEISNKLTETIKSQSQDSNRLLTENGNDVKQFLSKFKADESEAFNTILKDVNESFIDVINITDSSTAQEFQNTTDFFRNKLYDSMNNVTNDFNLFYDQSISLFDGMISQLTKSKESLEANKEKLVTGTVKNMASIGEKMETSFHSMVEFLKSNFEKDKKRIQYELESKMESYNSDFSSRLNSLESEITKVITNSSNEQKNLFVTQESNISEFANAHTNKAKTTFSNLTQEVRIKMDDFITDQKRLIDTSSLDIQKKLQANQSEIISKLEAIPPQVVSISDTFEENRAEKFSKASNEMDNAVDLFEREINDWAGDLNSIIGQEVASVQKNVGDRRTESNELFKSALSDLSDNSQNLSGKNDEEVNNVASDINARLDDLGSTVTTNIDQFANQFDTQLTKFISKGKEQSAEVSSKAAGFTEQTERFKTSSQESFEKLANSSKFQIDNIIKPSEKLIKGLENAIISAKKPS